VVAPAQRPSRNDRATLGVIIRGNLVGAVAPRGAEEGEAPKRQLTLWDAQTRKEVFSRELVGKHRGSHDGFGLPVDGAYVAWMEKGAIQVFDVRRRATFALPAPARCKDLQNAAFGMMMLAAGKSGLVAAAASGGFCLWNVRTRAFVRFVAHPQGSAWFFVSGVSDDGRELLLGSDMTRTGTAAVVSVSVATGKWSPLAFARDVREEGEIRVGALTLRQSETGALVAERPGAPPLELEQSLARKWERGTWLKLLRVRSDGAYASGFDEYRRGILWDTRTGKVVWSSARDIEVPADRVLADPVAPGVRCRAGQNLYEPDLCADVLRPIE
jgi:hypothetical protein